jgi:CheY-like chemotaxis protein
MATLNDPTGIMQLNPTGDVAALAAALSDPLDGLMAMAALLQRQPLAPAGQAQLQVILNAAERMAEALQEAKDQQGLSAPPMLEPVCLRSLLDEIEDQWRVRNPFAATKLLISCNASPELRVMADRQRLRRLFNTLIGDALESSPAGVVDLQLSALSDSDGMITLLGRMEAPGGGRDGGESAALGRCRALIVQMDGDIDRSPNPGAGAQTSFVLRLGSPGQASLPTPDAEPEALPLPPRTHLLIVDDNATNRIVAAALCEMFGCTSETAEDGLEAVEAVRQRRFDLILMDIKMPRMDGMEATRAIRALPAPAGQIPIIALTANADPDAVKTYLACGMQAVVDKPIKPQQLLTTLQWVLCDPDTAPLHRAVA